MTRRDEEHVELITSARPGLSESQRVRARRYAWIMGTCLTVLAWFVVRLWSTDLAVAMSVVAMVLPPVAAIVANRGAD